MKRLFIIGLLLMTTAMFAEESPKVYDVDAFEDGTIAEEPEWWTFGEINPVPVSSRLYNGDPLQQYLGENALSIKGSTDSWYIGGIGTYVGIDASRYTHLKLYVYGNGPKSGKLTIQFYDDDNNNFKLEQDVENDYDPIFDDKFEYTQEITWKGWKVLLIPIAKFKDVNKTVGDNQWNPTTNGESGGLLHFQIVCLSVEKEGVLDVALDNIKLVDMGK